MKLKWIIIVALIGLTGCSKEIDTIQSIEDKQNIVKNINKIYIDKDLVKENLINISKNSRKFGTNGEIEASNYLKDKLISYGYGVEFQDFDVNKQDIDITTGALSNEDYLNNNFYNSQPIGVARNIIATPKKFDKNKRTIYLTAHYDTTEDTVGVVDNASGTAAVLELSRVLKNYTGDVNVKFIFFSAEEYYRAGSRYYISNMTEIEKENSLGCINIDMIGEKGKGDTIMHTVNGQINVLSLMLDKLSNNKFELNKGGASDDLSFYMGKIPVVNICSDYIGDRIYEDAESNIDSIDFDQVEDTCNSIVEVLYSMDIKLYNDILKENRDLDINEYKDSIKSIGTFTLNTISEKLLENGYDVEVEYIYISNDGKKCVIKEKSSKFMPKNIYKDLIVLDPPNIDGYKLEKDGDNLKLIFINGFTYGEISGNVNSNDLLAFYNKYYEHKNL